MFLNVFFMTTLFSFAGLSNNLSMDPADPTYDVAHYITYEWDGAYDVHSVVQYNDYVLLSGSYQGVLDLGDIVLNATEESLSFCTIYDSQWSLKQVVILEAETPTQVLGFVGRRDQFGLVLDIREKLIFLPIELHAFYAQEALLKTGSDLGNLQIHKLVPETIRIEPVDYDPVFISDSTGSSVNPNPTDTNTDTRPGTNDGGTANPSGNTAGLLANKHADTLSK